MTTNPQSKIPDELKKIKDEIVKLKEMHGIGEMGETDIKNTVRELRSANEVVNKMIEELNKIKSRLNGMLMLSEKDEHKVSSKE